MTPRTKAGQSLVNQWIGQAEEQDVRIVVAAIEEEAVGEYREALRKLADSVVAADFDGYWPFLDTALDEAYSLLRVDQVAAAEPGR